MYDDRSNGAAGGITNGWSLRCLEAFPGRPTFLPPVLNGGQMQLRFATWPGKAYLIQFKNSLSDPSWRALQTIVGDGSIQTLQYSVGETPQRFFRAVENP